MIDWELRYRELEEQIEQMLIKVGETLRSAEKKSDSENSTGSTNRVNEIIVDNKTQPTLVTIVADGIDMEYAVYLYGESKAPTKYAYQRNNTFALRSERGLVKRIKVFVRTRSDRERLGVKQLDLTK